MVYIVVAIEYLTKWTEAKAVKTNTAANAATFMYENIISRFGYPKSLGDALLDYGRIEWQYTLKDLQKALNVVYQDILDELDSVWCVKGLIVTHSNLMVTWKNRARMALFLEFLTTLFFGVFPRWLKITFVLCHVNCIN